MENELKPIHKRTRLLTGLAALIAIRLLSAQDTPQQIPAPVKKAMFWKVSSKDNVVYLLGSIHAGNKEMYPLAKEIEAAFEESSTLAVEADILHIDQQKIQAFMMKGMYEGEDNLWNHINDETKARMEKACELLAMACAPLGKMKPWLLSVMLPSMAMMKNGMDPKYGIDRHFLELAAKSPATKRILEIEGAEFQFKMLSSLESSLQEESLGSALAQMDKLKELFRTMREIWTSGDAEAMEAWMTKYMAGSEKMRKVMLDGRNPAMADAAETLLKGEGRGFVVVGAGHLVGKQGLAALMAARGYKVEQVALRH